MTFSTIPHHKVKNYSLNLFPPFLGFLKTQQNNYFLNHFWVLLIVASKYEQNFCLIISLFEIPLWFNQNLMYQIRIQIFVNVSIL